MSIQREKHFYLSAPGEKRVKITSIVFVSPSINYKFLQNKACVLVFRILMFSTVPNFTIEGLNLKRIKVQLGNLKLERF